ncbi:MAG: protein adenylyltransferase SelO family protein [Desulfobacterales bacterium]
MFYNQPAISQRNIARLECLLPLISEDTKGLAQVEPVIAEFPARFEKAYLAMMGKKLGLTVVKPEDKALITSILNRLKEKRLDYTITFDRMTRSLTSEAFATQVKNDLGDGFDLWQKRLKEQSGIFSLGIFGKHRN